MNSVHHIPVLILLLCLGGIGYNVSQADFISLISLYTLAFGAYIFTLKKRDRYFFLYLVGATLVARIMMIPALPQLSDDIYRFYWDAWVYDQGISPYTMHPSDLRNIIPLNEMEGIYQQLNSPDYFSVYPPLLQWIFRCAYWISPSFYGFTVVYKCFILAAECVSMICIYLSLNKWGKNANAIFLYALNPLIILELCGNGHPEAFMIAGLSIMIYGLLHFPLLKSMGWAIAIAAKIQPLLLTPLILSYSKIKRKVLWIAGSLLLGLLTFIPLIMNFDYLQNFTESLRLYAQSFEFNGSLYKIFRWIGFQLEGYNTIQTIGPLLAFIAFTLILSIGIYHYVHKRTEIGFFLKLMILSWFVYLLCSPVVHPWYISPLILFAVFIKFQSVIVWSYLIMLSYVAYIAQPVYEPQWLPFVEYAPILILLYLDLKDINSPDYKSTLN